MGDIVPLDRSTRADRLDRSTRADRLVTDRSNHAVTALPCQAVPWCEDCSKYLTPSSLDDEGRCPSCGRPVGEIEQRAADELEDERAPWHFKLLVVALVVYLAWRFIQIFA